MAKQGIQIDAKPRAELGSRANKRLRGKGLVPGVVYGHKEAVIPVTLPKKELVNHLHRGAHLFDDSGGDAEPLLREWLKMRVRVYYHERSKHGTRQEERRACCDCHVCRAAGDSSAGHVNARDDADLPF